MQPITPLSYETAAARKAQIHRSATQSAALTPLIVGFMVGEAEVAARRFVRQFRLPFHDVEDIQQQILLEILARWPAYAPGRGTPGEFLNVVIQHILSRIARRIVRGRRTVPWSLDAPIGGLDGATYRDILPASDGLGALFGQPFDAHAETERRLDLERGLGELNADDLAFCRAIADDGVARLNPKTHGARSTRYRRLDRVRLDLRAHGVRPGWDDSGAG